MMRIVVTSVLVDDQEKALAFYTDGRAAGCVFETLRRAELDEDYTPFARFILDAQGGGSAHTDPDAR